MQDLIGKVKTSEVPGFSLDESGVLWFGLRLCVPSSGGLSEEIMTEGHSSSYSVHPGHIKMYRDLCESYWWPGMKKDITEFVSRCLTCQQVTFEHQHPSGLLQQMPLPEWKWDRITMDFVVGL